MIKHEVKMSCIHNACLLLLNYVNKLIKYNFDLNESKILCKVNFKKSEIEMLNFFKCRIQKEVKLQNMFTISVLDTAAIRIGRIIINLKISYIVCITYLISGLGLLQICIRRIIKRKEKISEIGILIE